MQVNAEPEDLMPLKALWDGREVVSIFLPDAEWEQLRASQRRERGRLRMADGARGIGKVSKLGLRFFAHAPGQGTTATAPESAQHLTLKAEIARACAEAGWTVDVEARGDGWVADVLASRADRRIAFEVQWSHQTAGDYGYRTARYRDAGIDSVWLRRVTPNGWDTRAGSNVFDMPARATDAATDVDVKVPKAEGGRQTVAVNEFTNAVLDRRIRPVGAEVSVWREKCWSSRCGKPITLWVVAGERPWPLDRALARGARRYVPPQGGAALAKIEPRTTKASGTTYDAFCCPHCNAVIGDNYVWDHLRRYQYIRTIHLPGKASDPWCAVTELATSPRHRRAPLVQLMDQAEVRRIETLVAEGKQRRRTQARLRFPDGDLGCVAREMPRGAAGSGQGTLSDSPTQVWIERCWRQACGKPFTAWAVKGEPAAPKTRSLARAVMHRVRSIDEHPLMEISVQKVAGWDSPYDSPCCPWCHLPARDYYFDARRRGRVSLAGPDSAEQAGASDP